MSNSTHLQLPFLAAAQAQKHVSVNEALNALDAIVQLAVIDQTQILPPVTPAEGDRYIVGPGATGDWAGKDGQVASFIDGIWQFYQPKTGWIVWVENEATQYVFKDANWQQDIAATSASDASIEFHVIEEELILSGASVDSVIVIPDRAIVFGVSTRITEAITGAASYECGISGEVAKFGGSLGVLLNATNSGVIGPTAFYTDTPVRLTANGSNFISGKVRIAMHYVLCGAPQQ